MRSTVNAIAASFLLALAGCSGGGSTPSTPTTPSTPSVPVTPTRIIALSGDLSFGTVAVGQTADRTLTIQNTGNSTLTVTGMTGPSAYTASWTSGTIAAGASQSVTVRFAPVAPVSYSGTVTVSGDYTAGTNTISISGTGSGPRTQFGSGQYRVNTDIQAARYFSDPSSGCYWERLRGLSGSLSDVLANEFIGFNAMQEIVDVLPSDVAFSTDADCGTWFQTQRHGSQTTIRPGTWLVGSQVAPGVYSSTVADGCYWERLRDFRGILDSINDNDFVSSAGPRLVEIRSSDVGFSTDGDCGTWTLTSTSALTSVPLREIRSGTIASRRDAERATWPRAR